MRHHLLIIVLLFAGTALANAQVTIAPTNLFIDSGDRFGTYMVVNASNSTQEISIDFFFGYTESDSDGRRSLNNSDTVRAEIHSIADNVRAFPRNFTLTSGQRQIVRLRVSAPNEIPDGTYWARIRTASTPESAPIEIQNTEDAVSARVGITVEQVTGLYYKKGDVSTGIEILDMNAMVENDQLIATSNIRRTGNSPFLGTISMVLYDSNNRVVAEGFSSTTIFFDGTHRQAIDISEVEQGQYRLELKFESQRNDISSSDIVQMETTSRSITYTIR